MSAIIPGAGQVYNRKYWKVPVVYGFMGYLAYKFTVNNKLYEYARNQYNYKTDTSLHKLPDNLNATKEYLQGEMDLYRRNRDLNVLLFIGVYALNIVDATVDAYLFNYDIGDDLSMRIEPKIWGNPFSGPNIYGLNCSFKFK